MAKSMTARSVALSMLLGPWMLLVWACDSNESAKTNGGSGNLPPGVGYCMRNCSKDCETDSDCQMDMGELCCNLGTPGKTCMQAEACPRACASDDKCSTASGELCRLVSLNNEQKMCTPASQGIRTCSSDAGCTTNEVCCGNYSTGICTAPTQCPRSCAQSTDCDTTSGEVCCTTVKLVEPSLKVTGLCLNPQYQACPKTCSESADCDMFVGELCCEGLCSLSCPKQCQASTDCNGEICCKSALTRMSGPTQYFSAGPRCTGTPTSCSSSSCSAVLGCMPTGDSSGTCTGAPTPCTQLSASTCFQQPGCFLRTSQ